MKDELRYKYRIKRKYFQYARREVADAHIAQNFLSLFAGLNSFFIYNSFGSEADTHGIISALLSLGKSVFLPRVEGDVMVAARYLEGDRLVKSAPGIYEPASPACAGPFDVAAVPLLAVNSRGFRLGYGGGYYDKFLKDMPCIKAGIGYDFQLDDAFQEDAWDVPLDVLITEKGVYRFGQQTDF